jgi:hypothetical protein
VVLIAAAVILGLFLLRAVYDDTPSGTTEASGTTAASGDTTDTTAADGSTTTAAPPRPAAEVVVRVANASGVQGAAGEMTQRIAGAGYQTVPETNAPDRLDATQILFAEGFDREAAALAEAMGAPAESAVAMPAQPPVDPGGAQIVILLGPDLAGG